MCGVAPSHPFLLIYAGNEPKSVLAQDLGDCRDNHKKLEKRVSYDLREQQKCRKELVHMLRMKKC